MKQTLNAHQMAALLMEDNNANWTYDGALALSEYLIDQDEQTASDTEFNCVDIRCAYSQHSSLEQWADDYGSDIAGDDDDTIRKFIQERSELIEFEGGVIVAEF